MTGFTRPPPPLQYQGTGPYNRPLRQTPVTNPGRDGGGVGWTAGQSGRIHSPNYSQRNTGDRAQPRGAPLKDIAEGHTTEKRGQERGQERAQERRSLKKSSMSRAHSSARTPAYTSGAGATRPSRSTS